MGDGSLGMLEGHDSRIFPDGSQNMRSWTRADCIGETSMTLSLAEKVTGQAKDGRVAVNLIDYLLLRSNMASGPRMDPQSPAFGLTGWNNTPNYYKGENGFDVYYGDDNARCLLGILATMRVSGETRWLERFWLAVLAYFRLVGRQGFEKSRHDGAPLLADGWRHYFDADTVLRGKWRWTESITSQQARLLLPLAWLVRVSDTAEHRGWLRLIATGLLSHQHASGAIREWTGPPGTGVQEPPTSNEKYGMAEAPLIQTNGDPAADLLYTMNFAFIGMHEAYAATGEPQYKEAEDKMSDFLIRVQVRSEVYPEFNGAWFRAFDFEKWDYWASSSDSGWGAWCTESGWSQSWLTTTFALRILKRSLWDVASGVPAFNGFDNLRESMFPTTG